MTPCPFGVSARSQRRIASATLACALFSSASGARAQGYYEPPREAKPSVKFPPQSAKTVAPSEQTVDGEWYGWQTLIADGAALTLFVGGAALSDTGSGGRTAAILPLALGGSAFFLGTPTIHATHGNWGTAAGSLGLRVALPLLGTEIGAGIDRCGVGYDESELCPVGGMAFGALIGLGTAMGIDAALLSYEHASTPASNSAPAPVTISAMPYAFADRNRAVLGLSGTF